MGMGDFKKWGGGVGVSNGEDDFEMEVLIPLYGLRSRFILHGSLQTNNSLRFRHRLLATSMEPSGKMLRRYDEFLIKWK